MEQLGYKNRPKRQTGPNQQPCFVCPTSTLLSPSSSSSRSWFKVCLSTKLSQIASVSSIFTIFYDSVRAYTVVHRWSQCCKFCFEHLCTVSQRYCWRLQPPYCMSFYSTIYRFNSNDVAFAGPSGYVCCGPFLVNNNEATGTSVLLFGVYVLTKFIHAY